MKTRAFKSGNSQAIRIPAEIALADISRELDVVRIGDGFWIRPSDTQQSMRETFALLDELPVPATPEDVDRGPGRDTLDDLD